MDSARAHNTFVALTVQVSKGPRTLNYSGYVFTLTTHLANERIHQRQRYKQHSEDFDLFPSLKAIFRLV